jgi:DNA-binding transcriptional regulator YhcF (GntR family)
LLLVNPNTVQRALAELERRGLARSERTAGRFVTDDVALIDAARNDLAAEAAAAYARRAQRLGMSLTAARDLLGRQWSGAIEGEDA